jgi:hypothetical protein
MIGSEYKNIRKPSMEKEISSIENPRKQSD